MAENNPLNKLFAQNVSKEQFVQNFNDMKNNPSGNDDLDSVFTSDMDVNTAGELFKTLDTNNDGKLTNDELTKLKQSYNDNDNNKQVSVNDLNELYSQTITRLGKSDGKDNAGTDDKKTEDVSTSPMDKITSQIDVITDLKNARQTLHESKMQRLQNELDSIAITSSDLSQKEKKEYTSNINKINKQKTEKKEKEQELEQIKNDMDNAQAEIDYIKSKQDPNTEENQKKIKEATKEYNGLKSKYASVSNDLGKINNKIERLYEKQQSFLNEINSNKGDLKNKKDALTLSMQQENLSYKADIQNYETQYNALKAAEETERANGMSDYPAEMYSDEDTSKFSYDAKALKSKWGKKHPNLSDGFFNKVCELSKRVGCDPNGLMAVMQSESGLKSTARNKSSGATGLIQFMPKTARNLGTSTDALSKMSPEQQLVYVEKYLDSNKKMAGIKSGEKVDNATLYTLVFLPAYAKRDVLATSGSAYYRSNRGLDMDHDGRITKADMRVRMNQMIAKA